MPPAPDLDTGTPAGERHQRVVHAALLVVLLVAAGAGVTAMRDWLLRPGGEYRLQGDFDEFHLEDRFHRVSEDTRATGPEEADVRLTRVYRTSLGPQDAAARVRTALLVAGVASTVRATPEGWQLASTTDRQDRGREVSAAVTVNGSADGSSQGGPTTVKVVLSGRR